MFLQSTRHPMWWNPLAETNVFATYLFSPQSNCADLIVASKFMKFCIGVINIWLRGPKYIYNNVFSGNTCGYGAEKGYCFINYYIYDICLPTYL